MRLVTLLAEGGRVEGQLRLRFATTWPRCSSPTVLT
jgi:hypothetical protein